MQRTNHGVNRIELRSEARDLLLERVGGSASESPDGWRWITRARIREQGLAPDSFVVNGVFGGSHHAVILLKRITVTEIIQLNSHDNEADDVHEHR